MERYDVEQYYDREGKPKESYDVERRYDDETESLSEDMKDQSEQEDYADKEIEMRPSRERTSPERRVSHKEWEDEKVRREEDEFWKQQEDNLRAMKLSNKLEQK